MRNTIHHEGLALVQHGEQAQPGPISEAQVLGLPEPMQRYLSYAQVIGKESIRAVHLTQEGFMRTQPDQKWLPFVAHLASGDFTWFRCKITEIEYNQSGKVTVL